MLGGTRGADRFVFDDGDSGNNHTTRDMIVRLSAADGDLVDLSAIDANTGASGNQAFTWIGRADFTAAGQVRWYTYRSDGMLHEVIELNTGGASGPEMQIKIVDTLIPTPDLFVL